MKKTKPKGFRVSNRISQSYEISAEHLPFLHERGVRYVLDTDFTSGPHPIAPVAKRFKIRLEASPFYSTILLPSDKTLINRLYSAYKEGPVHIVARDGEMLSKIRYALLRRARVPKYMAIRNSRIPLSVAKELDRSVPEGWERLGETLSMGFAHIATIDSRRLYVSPQLIPENIAAIGQANMNIKRVVALENPLPETRVALKVATVPYQTIRVKSTKGYSGNIENLRRAATRIARLLKSTHGDIPVSSFSLRENIPVLFSALVMTGLGSRQAYEAIASKFGRMKSAKLDIINYPISGFLSSCIRPL